MLLTDRSGRVSPLTALTVSCYSFEQSRIV